MYIRLFVLSLLLNGCQSKNQDKPSPIESYFEIEETKSAKSKAFELYPTEYRILKDRSLVHRIN